MSSSQPTKKFPKQGGQRIWTERAQANGSYPLQEFASRFLGSFHRLNDYTFYLSADDTNVLVAHVEARPHKFDGHYRFAAQDQPRSRSPASGIMGPDAPRWARNAGNTPVGLVPGPARGVHPYNRTADYVDPAAPQHQPSAPSLESRRGASSANGSSTQAYTPDTSASGSARDGSQYNAKYKVEHMVETWMSHAEVIAITKDRGKTPSLDAYKSDRQVKDKKFRRDLGHRRIRLFIQEFNNLNAKRRANGEKEEPAKPKCNAKGWMDDATAMGDYFLSGSGKKSGSSTTMRTADAAEDDDEEYEDDGEEDHE